MMKFYTGCVEDRDDPLRLGRCRVRIVGLHSENKTLIPTDDLPWAYPMTPVTSAAMNGIGWTPVGPVLGTWVVIIFTDADEQQPLMIGTLPGIPQSKAATIALEESDSNVVATNGGVLTDSSGKPVTAGDGVTPIQVGTQEASSSPASTAPSSTEKPAPDLTAQKEPNKPSDSALKQPIPVKPPPNSTADPARSQQNIQHLIDACDQLGLTTKYAKAAILGICGGESSWLPVEEGFFYRSAEQLAKIFSRTFHSAAEAQAYTKWSGSRKDFFNKIYNPQGNGKLVGNKEADDGGKYYGRGFNQLTGRPGYQQTEKFLKHNGIQIDLMNNPQSLIDDPKTAALACVAFYKMNVTHSITDPGYFGAALKRTGADAAGTGYEKKKKYYEYFLGEVVGGDPTNKPAADAQKTYTPEQVKDLPPSTQAALLEDRSSNSLIGFSDPSGKYPLRNLMDEPDTNRLARGIQKDTALEFKDSDRK
jgi:predicted chitinase